ncbi:hypothetical protein KA005_31775, partial [bacterium]|nr:hypothetical protein [bacterium]
SSASASDSVDSDNNSNVTIAANSCIGASQDALDTATGYSFQRKTFWDSANERYWLFYYDGTHIEVRYSSDASTWNVDDDILAYDTNDFSLWWDQIGTTEYVWLAVPSSNDIVVRRGELSTTGVAWHATASVALDGTGVSDTYSYTYISKDSSNYLWVLARHYDGTNYAIETIDSSTQHTEAVNWATFAWNATSYQISDDPTDTNVFGNIVPLASQDMYATFVVNTALEGCIWDYDHDPSARWEDSGDVACSPTEGGGGGEYELRDSDGPNKIDDDGDPGPIPGNSRQMVQTSTGTLYAVVIDGSFCEVWMSVHGETWTEQDSANNPSANGCNVAIDNNNDLHIGFSSGANARYIKFTTSTNTFGTAETIETYGGDLPSSSTPVITIDSANNAPHAVFIGRSWDMLFPENCYSKVDYSNRISSWKTPVTVEGFSGAGTQSHLGYADITIDEDDLPLISYIQRNANDLTA